MFLFCIRITIYIYKDWRILSIHIRKYSKLHLNKIDLKNKRYWQRRFVRIMKFIFIEKCVLFANLSFLWYNIEIVNLQNLDVRRYVRLVTSWQVWNAVCYKQYYHTKYTSLHLITFLRMHSKKKHKK